MSLNSNLKAVIGKITEATDSMLAKIEELNKLDAKAENAQELGLPLWTEIQQHATTIKSFSADLKTLL